MLAKLGDMCEVLNGYAFKSEQYVDHGVRIIRISNVQKGFIEDSDPVFYAADTEEVQKYSLAAGDLLMSLTGNVGRVAILSTNFLPAALNQRVACLRVKDSKKIDKTFLFHLLNSDYFEQKCIAASKGVAQKNMSTEWLKEYEISLLPMEQQQFIVSVLGKVDGLIALRKQQLAKLDELVKARFVEMFGDPTSNPFRWKKERFDTLCENLDSRRVPITASERRAGVYPYYGASGIVDYVNDYIFNEDILLISEDGANLVARVTPIAFSVKGKVWVNNHAHVVRFKQRYTQNYIEHYFALIDISSCITGTAQPKLNQAKLNAMSIPIPPESIQNRFWSFVQQVEKCRLTVQQGLDKLEMMKKALMQEYFGD